MNIKTSFSAVIPSFNAETTLSDVINSIRKQKVKPVEILVIDDCSTDKSVSVAVEHKTKLISLKRNSGRGKVRNKGLIESNQPFVLFCDSSNLIDPNFVKTATIHFDDSKVAAVFGRIKNAPQLNDCLSRWRGRHLFKEDNIYKENSHEVSHLITYAVLLKKQAIIDVGNFNSDLRQCEDQEMGDRLIKHGYKIISDPSIFTYSLRKETLTSLAIRYDRWYSNYQNKLNKFSDFSNKLKSSISIFAKKDFQCGDFVCVAISLVMPFWILWLKLFCRHKLNY